MKLFLRVGVWRGGKLVDDRFLPETGEVTFGNGAENTFGLLGSALPETRVLARFEGHQPVLLVSEGMTGEFALDGKARESLEKLRAKGQPAQGGWSLALPEAARGWVALGGVTFFVQQAPKPPPPPRSTLPKSAKTGLLSGMESTFLAVFLAVMSVEGLGVFAINRRPYIEADAPVGREDIDRFVTVQETPPEPEKPKDEPKKEEAKKEEPKKDEGKKPEKAPVATPQEAKSQAQEKGKQMAMEMMGSIGQDGAFDQIIRGDSEKEAQLADALNNVSGNITTASNATTDGRGTSHADGATGIGDLNGAIGGGGGSRTSRQAAVVADRKIPVAAPVEVDNSLIDIPSTTFSSADLAKAVRTHMGSVKSCYEKQLKLNPSLKGKIVMRFTITAQGRVSEASAESDSMHSDDVVDCIARLIRTWSFSFKPEEDASVSFPFVFSSAN
jgi:outer membrane biosynthesis protein TonB